MDVVVACLHIFVAMFHICYMLFCFICICLCVALLYVIAMLVCLIYMYVYTFYACSHQFVKCCSRYKRRMLYLELAFCYILLLITLKVRFRIKYRILLDFGFVLDLFSRAGYPHHLQMRCIFVFFVRKFFPVEPRKGGAGEIFSDSGRQKNFEKFEKF